MLYLHADLVPAAMIVVNVMTAVTVIAVPVVTIPVAATVPVTIAVPTDYHDRRSNIHRRRRCVDDGRWRRCIDRLWRNVDRRGHADIDTKTHLGHCRAGHSERPDGNRAGKNGSLQFVVHLKCTSTE